MGSELHQKLLIQGLYELGDFNGGLAHEINNPLAILLGQISIMKMMLEKGTLTSEKISQKLDKLEDATQRVIDLVENMRKIPCSVTDKEIRPIALAHIIEINSFLIAYPCKKFEIDYAVKFESSDIADEIYIECIWEEVVVVLNTVFKSCIAAMKELEDNKFLKIEVLCHQELAIHIKAATSFELDNDLLAVCRQIVARYKLQLDIKENSLVLTGPFSQLEAAA